MTYADVIERLEREKVLVRKLNAHLQRELDFIASDDVQALEDSMPAKQKIIRTVQEIRQDSQMPSGDPNTDDAERMRSLQQDLVRLWKKATGLNEISKRMVSQRLSEIDDTVQAFFIGLKESYTREGRKSTIPIHTIRTGA
jgi:Mg2+ and Co2+ transporter CorA